jgi:hypothetical protein
MDTKSLDTLIREKARRELNDDIGRAATRFIDAIAEHGYPANVMTGKLIDDIQHKDVNLSAVQLINWIASFISDEMAHDIEQVAVADFIQRHEQLEHEILELREASAGAGQD